MANWRSATERKTPRRERRWIKAEKKVETALSRNPDTGVKLNAERQLMPRLAGDARSLTQQAVHPSFRKVPRPVQADTGAPGHLEYRQPHGREQDNPNPQHVLVRAASIAQCTSLLF